jgi:hypothetical protein
MRFVTAGWTAAARGHRTPILAYGRPIRIWDNARSPIPIPRSIIMLVTFKSKAAADIPMYPEHAKMLLSIVGKSFEPESAPRGIITAAEAPAALAKLKAAADASRRTDKEHTQNATDDEPGQAISVGLAQRAFPLIDMLERAARDQRDVVWGV